jgi:hypothetical protein
VLHNYIQNRKVLGQHLKVAKVVLTAQAMRPLGYWKEDIVREDGLSLLKSSLVFLRRVPESDNISVSLHYCRIDVAMEE